MAQGLYTPVAKVNQTVVTEFEVQQRQKFLQALNAPGATRQGALDSLIDERLRNEAVTKSGIELSAETIEQSLSEFAGRANLGTDEFVKRLEQSGISSPPRRRMPPASTRSPSRYLNPKRRLNFPTTRLSIPLRLPEETAAALNGRICPTCRPVYNP